MSGVKGLVGSKIRFAVQNHAPADRRRAFDPAVRINYRAYSGICGTHLVSTIFHCPNDAHPQVLKRSRRFAKPAVIRDHNQHLGATHHKLADEIRENALITDNGRETTTVQGIDGEIRTRLKVADLSRQAGTDFTVNSLDGGRFSTVI